MARRARFHRQPSAAADNPMAPDSIRRLEFGRRLQNLMLERGLNQSDLARKSNLRKDSISTYVNGKTEPEPKNAKKIADALGVDIFDLYPQAGARAAAEDPPAIEMRQSAGRAGFAWIRLNREVSMDTATRIIELVNADDKKAAEQRG